MNWLFQNPLVIAIGTALVVLVFLAALLKTGKRLFVALSVISLLAGTALFVAERQIITPLEQIKLTLGEITTALASNDVDAVLAHISTEVPDIRKDARAKLALVSIREVKIKQNLKVTFAEPRGQAVALAKFNAVAYLSDKAGQITDRPYPRFVTLNFRRESEQWKISGYELSDPMVGLSGE